MIWLFVLFACCLIRLCLSVSQCFVLFCLLLADMVVGHINKELRYLTPEFPTIKAHPLKYGSDFLILPALGIIRRFLFSFIILMLSVCSVIKHTRMQWHVAHGLPGHLFDDLIRIRWRCFQHGWTIEQRFCVFQFIWHFWSFHVLPQERIHRFLGRHHPFLSAAFLIPSQLLDLIVLLVECLMRDRPVHRDLDGMLGLTQCRLADEGVVLVIDYDPSGIAIVIPDDAGLSHMID